MVHPIAIVRFDLDHSDMRTTNPTEIDWRADDQTIDALKRLLGFPLRSAITSSLRVHLTGDGPQIRTEKVALVGPEGIVTVAYPDWADTERFAMNAFLLEARHTTDAPEWVRGEYVPETGAFNGFWTGLRFDAAFPDRASPSRVRTVTIYRRVRERRDVERELAERVAFDNAVLLDRETGSPPLLLFVDESSIAGLLGVSTDADEIADVLEGCTRHHVLE